MQKNITFEDWKVANLYISDPPEIEVDQSWVPTGEGIEAEVSCNIHAEPPADVSVMAWKNLVVSILY